MKYPGFGEPSIVSPEYNRGDKPNLDPLKTWTQVNHNGNYAPRTANPTLQWTDQKVTNKTFPTLQRSVSKGNHGTLCPKGCMPEMMMTGEILHYIPNAATKVPGYEAMDSHYVLMLDDSFKTATYRDNRDWCACLVISSHPPPELQHRPLRPRTEPCYNPEVSMHFSTTLFDRFHACNCADIPYCTHVSMKSKYDRKLWRAWDWCADTQISLEAPKMVHKRCLHVLRPMTPSLGVSMTLDSLYTVYRMIAAQMAPQMATAFVSNDITNNALTRNANCSWSGLLAS